MRILRVTPDAEQIELSIKLRHFIIDWPSAQHKFVAGITRRLHDLSAIQPHDLNMDHATLHDMAVLGRARARNRTPPRQLHGWAVMAVRDAACSKRTVQATPRPENIHHADIFLNIVGDDVRDKQKAHATELAARSRWLDLP